MRNLSISKKLILGFGVVLVLMLVTIGMSVVSLNTIQKTVETYEQYTLPNNTNVWVMRRELVSGQRFILRAFNSENIETIEENFKLAQQDDQLMMSILEEYASNQRNTNRDKEISEVRALLEKAGNIRREIGELFLTQEDTNVEKAYEMFDTQYIPVADSITNILEGFSATAEEYAILEGIESVKAEKFAWTVLIVCGLVSIIATIIVIMAIRKSILTPIEEIVNVYTEISRGNMHVDINYQSRDELGQMAKLIQKTNMMQSEILSDLTEHLLRISKGDLSIRVDKEYPGDFRVMKDTIEDTISSLNQTMQVIHTAAEQVSMGSSQVASGAQALASGSTQQAASVEELTASIAQIAEQSLENSESVRTATQYVGEALAGVHTGNEHMQLLTEAMSEIGDASDQITNITKAIDDIAFQTNILALNAAIEAARAGSAGKGFAVVADEVRSLAGKSAEAAHQTAELIHKSVATVAKGNQISAKTAEILQDVGAKASLVNENIVNIDQASYEQTRAIEQIKEGLTQVSSVVQTNAATAEENSATSEEMSAQAATLKDEIGKFKLSSKYNNNIIAPKAVFNELPKINPLVSRPAAYYLGKY